MSVITEIVTLRRIDCGKCGGVYAITERYHDQQREDGGSWNCPYCKIGWGFAKGENAKLRDQIEAEKQRAELALLREKNALAEAEHFRKSRDGMKGALRKVSVRVKNGVCPCCKRTFSCLATHMAQKHPGFGKGVTP